MSVRQLICWQKNEWELTLIVPLDAAFGLSVLEGCWVATAAMLASVLEV